MFSLCGSQVDLKCGFCVHDMYTFTAFPVLKQTLVSMIIPFSDSQTRDGEYKLHDNSKFTCLFQLHFV
jgi:hypothetical protein